jgi:cell division protease FtsH
VRYGDAKGMGMVEFNAPKEYSDKTAETIDLEVKTIIDRAYADAKGMIERNREKLVALTAALIKYETLSADEVQQILDGKTIDKPLVADIINREISKTPGATVPPLPPTPAGPDVVPQPM